jgi:hypothetical protein
MIDPYIPTAILAVLWVIDRFFFERGARLERKQLYDRLMAGTLQDYTQAVAAEKVLESVTVRGIGDEEMTTADTTTQVMTYSTSPADFPEAVEAVRGLTGE